jgi:hypothetical protein
VCARQGGGVARCAHAILGYFEKAREIMLRYAEIPRSEELKRIQLTHPLFTKQNADVHPLLQDKPPKPTPSNSGASQSAAGARWAHGTRADVAGAPSIADAAVELEPSLAQMSVSAVPLRGAGATKANNKAGAAKVLIEEHLAARIGCVDVEEMITVGSAALKELVATVRGGADKDALKLGENGKRLMSKYTDPLPGEDQPDAERAGGCSAS